MIFLDKHNKNNGGLSIFPGSNQEGYIEHSPFININGLSKFMVPPKSLDYLNEKYGRLEIDAKPGDVLFFHVGLVHGSSHNLSPNNRMVALAQMNTRSNKPSDTKNNAKKFNISRTKREVKEAKRKYDFFSEKLEIEKSNNELMFNSPIQDEDQ